MTKGIKNSPGIYLVFCREEISKEYNHLRVSINSTSYTLLYFGKAGGKTKAGKLLTQGLSGRINNVVSDRTRNLKDVRRGKYWKAIMNEFLISSFLVVYNYNEFPLSVEQTIYNYLNNNKLKYPLMNKELGRGKTHT